MDKLLSYPGKTDKGVFTFLINEEKGYLEKTAAAYHPTIAAYINEAKPIPGMTQVLLTALGAGEYWGDNVNSDFFGEDQLAHEGDDYGYKTFKTMAKVFKHHCFVAGTPVKTQYGILPIEDVCIGDKVYTASGELLPVTDVFKRNISSDVIKIKTSGSDEPIVCTPEHPFLVVKRTSLSCPRHRNNPSGNFCTFYKSGEDTCNICGENTRQPKEEWVNAEDVSVGDYLVSVKSPFEKDGGDYEKALGVVAGFFLADGCYGKKDGEIENIQIVFWKERVKNHQKLLEACQTLGVDVLGPYEHKKNNTFTFVLKLNTATLKSFYGWFGEYSHEKKLSFSCLPFLGKAGVLSLIGAMIDGDGAVAKSASKNAGQTRLRSCNKRLLNSIRAILLDLGITASVCTDAEAKDHDLNGYTIKSSPSHVLFIQANFGYDLIDFSWKIKEALSTLPDRRVSNRSFSYGNKIYHFVSDIGVSTIEDTDVFNLEVDKEHTYQVNSLITHNCNKDPNASYGDVLLSVYNPIYHRVELIVTVRHKDAPDIIEKIESGNYPLWSMGAKIPYDICNICGNKAPNRKYYCDHLRYQLGQIDRATGRKVYAINIKPRFFDISYVLVPADKTAMTLKKVAYAVSPGGIITSSAEAAELSEKAAALKNATMEKVIPADPPASEDVINSPRLRNFLRAIPEMKAREPMIPREALDNMAETATLRDICTTFANHMILPKPQEFQRVFLISIGQRPLADRLDSMNSCFDPAAAEDAPASFDDILGLDSGRIHPKVSSLLSPFMEDRSYFAPLMVRRMGIMVKSAAAYPETTLPVLISAPVPHHQTKIENSTSPLEILGLGAALYIALSRGMVGSALRGLGSLAANHPIMTAAAAAGILAKLTEHSHPVDNRFGRYSGSHPRPDDQNIYERIEHMREKPYLKISSELPKGRYGAGLRRLLIGTAVLPAAAAVLQKRHEENPQREEGAITGFIRKHPTISGAALVADAMLATQGKGTIALTRHVGDAHRAWLKGDNLMKAANISGEAPCPEVKAASVGDYVSSSLIWPAVMGTTNLPGRIVGSFLDQAALDLGGKMVDKYKQRKVQGALTHGS